MSYFCFSLLGQFEVTLEIKKEQLADLAEIRYAVRHPSTASSYNNLAVLYYSMGRNEEALPLYQLALEIAQSVLGYDHPNTQIFRQNYEFCLQKNQK